jgi:hypothetical protein
MKWIAPSEKDTANGTLEKSLWDSADQFRANSGLNAQEYSGPLRPSTRQAGKILRLLHARLARG